MRGRTDPVWKRHYYDVVGRAHVQYSEGRITRRELVRKIEAARQQAYRLQQPKEKRC